jgi:hypothetical protein
VRRALVIVAALGALAAACRTREAELKLTVPPIDGGACDAFDSLRCVNYLEFSVQTPGGFTSQCVQVRALANLCGVANLANGGELFRLPPETELPITVVGKRVFPATGCDSPPGCEKIVFSGSTIGVGRIGDYADRTLEIAIDMYRPCGLPEQFYYLPDGGTCQGLCGPQFVICAGVQGGCLCANPMAGGQGGIDAGQ